MPEKVKAFTVNFHNTSRLNIFPKMDLWIPFSLLSVSKIAKLIKVLATLCQLQDWFLKWENVRNFKVFFNKHNLKLELFQIILMLRVCTLSERSFDNIAPAGKIVWSSLNMSLQLFLSSAKIYSSNYNYPTSLELNFFLTPSSPEKIFIYMTILTACWLARGHWQSCHRENWSVFQFKIVFGWESDIIDN